MICSGNRYHLRFRPPFILKHQAIAASLHRYIRHAKQLFPRPTVLGLEGDSLLIFEFAELLLNYRLQMRVFGRNWEPPNANKTRDNR